MSFNFYRYRAECRRENDRMIRLLFLTLAFSFGFVFFLLFSDAIVDVIKSFATSSR